jgi:cytoskeletal protein CcmA (bactofilin family)
VEAADKIDIKKEAKLVGDIKTSRIVIEDGAYFKGSIDISKTAPVKGPQQSQPQSQSQPASQPATQPAPVGSPIGAGSASTLK